MNEPPTPNCHGLHELFTSTKQDDHQHARTLCVDERGRPICEAFTACENTVRSILASDYRSGLHGTWAGRHYNPDKAGWQRTNARRAAARKAAS